MNELHLLPNRELIASIEDDLAAAHRTLAETVYKLAYNRTDEDLIERKRHLTERIELLGIALASARHVACVRAAGLRLRLRLVLLWRTTAR